MAAVTALGIANMALSHCGIRFTIEDLNEDTAEANACLLWYDYCRKQVLEQYDWGFGRRRYTLSLHADAAPEGIWTFRYTYPATAVAIRRITVVSRTEIGYPFETELNLAGTARTILTDVEGAVAVATDDVETTSLFSAYFVAALSHLLASYVAFPLTGRKEIADSQMTKFYETIRRAAAATANEAGNDPSRDADWVSGRA